MVGKVEHLGCNNKFIFKQKPCSWVVGWMEGSKRCLKDCLQQSRIPSLIYYVKQTSLKLKSLLKYSPNERSYHNASTLDSAFTNPQKAHQHLKAESFFDWAQ